MELNSQTDYKINLKYFKKRVKTQVANPINSVYTGQEPEC